LGGGTRLWTQGFTFTRQAFYHLNHFTSPEKSEFLTWLLIGIQHEFYPFTSHSTAQVQVLQVHWVVHHIQILRCAGCSLAEEAFPSVSLPDLPSVESVAHYPFIRFPFRCHILLEPFLLLQVPPRWLLSPCNSLSYPYPLVPCRDCYL
jgi:hypothetical protein